MARRKKQAKYNDNNFAVAYYRYSSASQKEASIEIQRDAVREYAVKQGLEIIREYIDQAKSGRSTEGRDGYKLMLHEIEGLRPHAVLLYQHDRLGRNVKENLAARIAIDDAGCIVDYALGSAPDLDDTMGWMFATMNDVQAQSYSDEMAEKIYDGIQNVASKGYYCGRKILGYRGEADRPYEIDPDTAPIVFRIFADYADGVPMADIAKKLNAEGRRTSQGKLFTVNGLRSILHNDAYIGVYEYAGHRIVGGMPAIIDKDLFARVQRKFGENKRQGSRKANGVQLENAPRFWLTGKLFCGHCGESMQGTSGTSKTGATHYYYQCNGRRGKVRNGCKKKNLRKEQIENTVVRVLRIFLRDTDLRANFAEQAAEYYAKRNAGSDGYLKSMENELEVVCRELDNLVNALKAGIWSETTKGELDALEERKAALLAGIEAEKAKLAVTKDTNSFAELFGKYADANLDDERVRDELLRYFIDKIYVFDDKLLITGWFAEGDVHDGKYDDMMIVGGMNVGFGPPGFESFVPISTMTRSVEPVTLGVTRTGWALEYRFEVA